jgi:hypothetical protein
MPKLQEVLRRVYSELVRRRTTVRVVQAAEVKLDTVPIFLTGVFRSGTTLLRYVIDSHSHICCPPESNFIRALLDLVIDRDNREGLHGMGFDEEHVLAMARRFAAYCFENYAKSSGKPRWADKTPRYVEYLDSIDRLFPSAQYVMIHRHGLDVADSIVRATVNTPDYLAPYLVEAEDARVAAAAYWSACTARMLAFEESHVNRCHTIRYEQLCRTPEPILKELFTFLKEAWEPEVLEYHRFQHDIGLEAGRASGTRGFSASEGHYRAWPSGIIARAEQAAKPSLARLGFEVRTSTSPV